MCVDGAEGMSELVRLGDDVRIGDHGGGEDSGVGERVEGDTDVAGVHGYGDHSDHLVPAERQRGDRASHVDIRRLIRQSLMTPAGSLSKP